MVVLEYGIGRISIQGVGTTSGVECVTGITIAAAPHRSLQILDPFRCDLYQLTDCLLKRFGFGATYCMIA